jgi:DNA-binding PadR family transcriptional regulator
MADRRNPEAFLPLSDLALHVMLALGDGPLHGYGIGKEIEERSRGRLNPTTGGLYQALKRLAEDGLVNHDPDAEADSPDSRRRYFRLTPLGRQVVGLEMERLQGLVTVAREKRLFPRSV